jgi:hypothetical protein|nr:hypothetical protein [Limnobacter sp. SAORIC-690]
MACGLSGQCAGKVRLAHSRGASEHNVLVFINPLAVEQFVDEGFIQPALRAQVNVLGACLLAQLCAAKPA